MVIHFVFQVTRKQNKWMGIVLKAIYRHGNAYLSTNWAPFFTLLRETFVLLSVFDKYCKIIFLKIFSKLSLGVKYNSSENVILLLSKIFVLIVYSNFINIRRRPSERNCAWKLKQNSTIKISTKICHIPETKIAKLYKEDVMTPIQESTSM